MNFQIQELYESVLITEMNQKVVDYLNHHTEELPFDHIFGDKMRVAFPIGTDVTAQSIIDDLRRIQNFDKIDLKNGEVVRKIKLDPKYGQGDYKEQKINMGKAISALKIPEDKKKDYLNWFAKYKDNLEAAFEKPEFIVVLSRAPIDVVRMSDHRNISSCHSQGGSYFHCAIQEAITGGAVAYVVREEDFNELTEEEFQGDEIFVDSDRGISGAYGLRPLARLRVRRLEDDEGGEVAIPDTKVYGRTDIPNFYNSLKNYLHRKQSITSDDFKGNHTRRGGTYYDDDIRSMLASYFETDEDKYFYSDFPRIEHNRYDQRSEPSHASIGLEDELNAIKERYQNRLEHSTVDFSIYDDEDVFFSAYGFTTIDLTKFNLPDDVELEVEDYEVRKTMDGRHDDGYEYSALVQYLHDKAHINIYKIEMTNTELNITFDDQESYNDPDKFDNFCYYVRDFDRKIEDMLEDEDELLQVFLDAGFLKEAPSGDPEYSMISEYLADENEWFDNFSLLGSRPTKSFTVKVDHRYLLNNIDNYTGPTDMSGILSKIVNNLAKENFKPKTNEEDLAQLQFNKFFESYVNPMEGINFMCVLSVLLNHSNYLVTDKFTFGFNKMNNKNFQFVQFLDDFFPHILNCLKLYCLWILKANDSENFENASNEYNFKQLEQVYSKYFK